MQREEGFLSSEMGAEIAVFRSKFAAWIALIQRLNHLAMTVLYAMRVNFNDHQKLCEAALFCKAVQHLQAGCLLVERGMAADARTALRSATETAIYQRKASQTPGFVDALEEHEDNARKRMTSAMLDDPEAVKTMTQADIEMYKKMKADMTAKYPQRGRPTALILKEVAESCDAMAFYNTIYRLMSNDAAHPSLTAASRHFREDSEGGFRLVFGPQDDDARSTLFGLANIFFETTMRAVDSFKLEKHVAEVLELFAELRKIAELPPAVSTTNPAS